MDTPAEEEDELKAKRMQEEEARCAAARSRLIRHCVLRRLLGLTGSNLRVRRRSASGRRSSARSSESPPERKRCHAGRHAEHRNLRALQLRETPTCSHVRRFLRASGQVNRLEFLLSKSIAYSEFLAGKIKTQGEGTTV